MGAEKSKAEAYSLYVRIKFFEATPQIAIFRQSVKALPAAVPKDKQPSLSFSLPSA